MPLFESQQARTDRLFLTAMLCAHRLARSVHEAPWLHICDGIICGGSVVARQSIKTYEQLQTLWGKGDAQKAAALTKVFSLAMLSFYLGPSDEREGVCREWAKAILELFDDDSAESLEHFLGVDRQYVYDRAGEACFYQLCDVIYFSDAVVALGGRPVVKVTAGELPIRNYTDEDLIGRGVISTLPDVFSLTTFSLVAPMVFFHTVADIERRLAQYYDGTPEGETHLRKAEELERRLKEADRNVRLKQDQDAAT